MPAAGSRSDELDALDDLIGQAQRAVNRGRPGAARELLLRARSGYDALGRPHDVGLADNLLRELNVAVTDREQAWDRLLREVQWRPGPPAATPMVVMVDCLGEQHGVAISHDWTITSQPSPAQDSEHVAAALMGVEPQCFSELRHLAAIRRWACCWQRLAPLPEVWLAPPGLGWVRPTAHARGWAADSLRWQERAWPNPSRLASPSYWEIPEGRPTSVFHQQLSDHPLRLPPPQASAAAQLRLGSEEGVEDLWALGIHPELIIAIHDFLGLDQPVPPATVAHLVLRRQLGSPDEMWLDDPLPIGVLRELLGTTTGARRVQMCQFLAAAGGARDGEDPQRLLRWWKEADAPIEVRISLHRIGFDPADLVRWSTGCRNSGPTGLAAAMTSTTPQRTGLPGHLDVVERCLAWTRDPDQLKQAKLPVHSCHRWLPKVLGAIESNDLGRLLRTVTAMDRDHPDANPLRGDCPLWVSGCVQLMAALHPSQPQAAATLRETLQQANRYHQVRIQWVWVVLEWAQHRLSAPIPPELREHRGELLYEILERRPTPEVPKSGWVDRFGPAAGLAWPRLRRSGLTPAQAAGWQSPTCPDPDFICWLADYLPYPVTVGDPGPDPIAWLISEGLRGARRWAALNHSDLYDDDAYLSVLQARDCLEVLFPALEQAIESGDPSLIRTAATRALSGHTHYRDFKSYRYHLDTCPVGELARLVLGAASFPDDLPEAARLLIGDVLPDSPDDPVEQVWYESALCMTGWLALTYQSGRLVEDRDLRAKWDEAARRSCGGPWMLAMVLQGVAGERLPSRGA